jgi:hypothetical protein
LLRLHFTKCFSIGEGTAVHALDLENGGESAAIWALYTLGSDAKCQVKGVMSTTGPSWMEQIKGFLGWSIAEINLKQGVCHIMALAVYIKRDHKGKRRMVETQIFHHTKI